MGDYRGFTWVYPDSAPFNHLSSYSCKTGDMDQPFMFARVCRGDAALGAMQHPDRLHHVVSRIKTVLEETAMK